MAKSFKKLKEKMSTKNQKKVKVKVEKMLKEMPLQELRKAFELTQVQVAEILQMSQAAVAKMESQTDMYISTLRRFVEAMGGELKIIASFPKGEIEITQFVSDEEKNAA